MLIVIDTDKLAVTGLTPAETAEVIATMFNEGVLIGPALRVGRHESARPRICIGQAQQGVLPCNTCSVNCDT